jgi:uncharacterized membrane protein
MDSQEDQEPSNTEKVTRIGCGALFGVFSGIYLAFRLTLSSSGMTVAVIVGAVLICGFLAFKYGDEFWQAIIGRSRS